MHRSRWALRVSLVWLCLAFLALTKPSTADTVDAVYNDIRDVMSELIKQRASEDAAAFVRRSSSGLGFYLNRSLNNVQRGQWGALHDSLRDDFADLASDYVLWELLH